ncbi:MAG: hypothetical protein OGM09_10570 [Fusobacterium varium]|uniref:hypothetical protein n=1 Tax=Fusobacterium varium TaxID=856 RepID=UPI002431EE00|nr:hypothetical protein [Fusobacterium varium]UYI77613.1 MAG: hypothetical protein OGM09_10570 [Fusobacterium varium]
MKDKELILTVLDFINAFELNKDIVIKDKILSNDFLNFEEKIEKTQNQELIEDFRKLSDSITTLQTDTQLLYLEIGLTLGELKRCYSNAE